MGPLPEGNLIRILARIAGLVLALILVAAGVLGALVGRGLSQPATTPLRERWDALVGNQGAEWLTGPAPFVALGVGVTCAVLTLLFTRRRAPEVASADGAPVLDRRLARKVDKQARAMVRKGMVHEAAEYCFVSGLLDRAAELYVEAQDWSRAAEILHDQNRFEEAAELHLKAGDAETAGSIFAAQEMHERAAECFFQAGRMSVAGEMFEKIGEHRRAADCYRKAEFPRQAAKAYIRCQAWAEAAVSLEQVVSEEGGPRASENAEMRKLVLQCGRLYEQAGNLDKAEAVLAQGGCPVAAAEIALRRERFARAAELFLEGGEPLRAADTLRRFGEEREAARILGEHHRNQGEHAEAARFLEEAEDHYAAADLYRLCQDYERAATAYERAADHSQAAEMHRLAGQHAAAADNFAQGGNWDEAAASYAAAGDVRHQAEALGHAGRFLEAGRLLKAQDLDDAAIKVLQQIPADHAEFGAAAAMLGELFRSRGQLGLAIKKLRQAIGSAELDHQNLALFYTLGRVCEENGDLREAMDLYEKILACDYHYEDVEARLTATRERTASPPAAESTDGKALSARSHPGRYQIVGELGRGGMGIVYKAKDVVLDRTVAYKVLPESLVENPQALKNFLREAKSAAQLNHPNIVTVFDAGQDEGRYYIAMEYVDGHTLKQIVRKRGAIPLAGVFHVLWQMCEALAYAHDKKIVHRDIKTANTMWTRERKAKIMDFGLAKVVEEVRNHTTLVSGTPYYMSPEQTLGRNIDHRTDLYSLGVTLFELATGTLPFTEGNIPYHHVHTPAPDPRDKRPELPEVLSAVIGRCLRKDPDERYASARDILAEVKAAQDSAGPATDSGSGGSDR